MNRTWILTALGKDRPGIVAGLTEILYKLGCNLEDSAMTRLAGEFATIVIFSSARPLTQARFEGACRPLAKRLGLVLHVKALTHAELSAVKIGKPHVLTVYGADHPGIVFRVSQLLAGQGVNITDVSTHRTHRIKSKTGKPLYLMVLDLELPPRLGARGLERRLRTLSKHLGVEVSLRSAEPNVF